MKRPQDDFRRVLVICTRQIGDVLLTTPLIAAAKARWPSATIDVLGFGGTLGMLRGNPAIDELIEVPAGSGWVASRTLIKRLWRRYDLALIAQYSDRAHLYGFVAARQRAGQVPRESRSWWKRALLTHAVVLDDSQSHAVVEKLRLLEPWVDAPSARLVPPPATSLPHDVAAALRPPYAVLQVPVAVTYKAWPVAHWVALIEDLVARGVQVVLTGAASAADRGAVDAVKGHLSTAVPSASASTSTSTSTSTTAMSTVRAVERSTSAVLDIVGRLDFNQLTTLLSSAAFYVGGDTSITHLATACDAAVVALYGPIDPRLFGPWPARTDAKVPYQRHALVQRAGRVTLLQGTPPCVPCNRAGCEDHNASASVCLQTMMPARVIEAIGLSAARPSPSKLSDNGEMDPTSVEANMSPPSFRP